MDGIIFSLELLIASVFGYYLFKLIDDHDTGLKTIISPFYGLFSLLAITTNCSNILFLFLSGAFWSIVVNIFLSLVEKRLTTSVNYAWFGILNIFNYYFLVGVAKKLIFNSSPMAIFILFNFGIIVCLLDLACYLRRAI